MDVIERFPAEFDRMPHYGAEGCVCGNIATPDRKCPLHAANWIIERLTDDLRGAVHLTEFERHTLRGFVHGIANAGLDTYGLSGAEKAAIGRALDKLRGQ